MSGGLTPYSAAAVSMNGISVSVRVVMLLLVPHLLRQEFCGLVGGVVKGKYISKSLINYY